jgi:hypothetical protein
MRYEAVPLQMCKNMLLSLTTSLNKVLSVFQGSFTQTAKKKPLTTTTPATKVWTTK